MAIDPQKMAAILQRVQMARQAGAGGAPMGGTPDIPTEGPLMGNPPMGGQGIPMQIQGVMSPMGGAQGGPPMPPPGGPAMGGPPPGMAPRPMMPNGMPPRGMPQR